jgi:hypothetical protein
VALGVSGGIMIGGTVVWWIMRKPSTATVPGPS